MNTPVHYSHSKYLIGWRSDADASRGVLLCKRLTGELLVGRRRGRVDVDHVFQGGVPDTDSRHGCPSEFVVFHPDIVLQDPQQHL
jgi:hypothetical protein